MIGRPAGDVERHKHRVMVRDLTPGLGGLIPYLTLTLPVDPYGFDVVKPPTFNNNIINTFILNCRNNTHIVIYHYQY